MRRENPYYFAILGLWLIAAVSSTHAESGSEKAHAQLLPGDRVLLGTVEDIRGGQAQINTGEVEPRSIPMGVRKTKGLPELKKGDRVEITVNDQNALVDVHLVPESSHHRVVKGQLAIPLDTGHETAVLRTVRNREESYSIRPEARSKVASIPVGVDAAFLIDEMSRIVDVTFTSKEAVQRAAALWEKKSPLKGNYDRIIGVVRMPVDQNHVVIRTEDGKEQRYEIRPFVLQRLKKLSKGDAVVLLVDEENKVADVAIPPRSSTARQR